MSDDWKSSYDEWKLRSPYDETDDPEPDERDDLERELDRVREDLRSAQSLIKQMSQDIDAATKWAAEYGRQHGPFKPLPAIPDFMIPF